MHSNHVAPPLLLVAALAGCLRPEPIAETHSEPDAATARTAAGPGSDGPSDPDAAPPAPAATSAPAAAAFDLDDWHVAEATPTDVTVAWRPATGRVPRNEPFEAEVRLLRGGAPVSGAHVVVDGDMPAHKHGLVRKPVVREVGDGRYAVEGLLLHMRGSWVVEVQVTVDGKIGTATYELEL